MSQGGIVVDVCCCAIAVAFILHVVVRLLRFVPVVLMLLLCRRALSYA